MVGERIIIVGGPRTGKTTLGKNLVVGDSARLLHTDDLIDKVSWSDTPDAIVEWMGTPGPWVVEGVQTARGLRRWLKKAKLLGWSGTPCDRVIVLQRPYVEQTKKQESMTKGIWTIWNEVEPLLPSDVIVEYR